MKKNINLKSFYALIIEIILGSVGGGLFGFIGAIIGFGIGANGSFEFNGVGGYEAGGILFGLIGTVLGSWLIIFFIAEKKYNKYSYIFSLIGCILAFLVDLKLYNYEIPIISYFFQLIMPSIIIITALKLSDIKNKNVKFFKKRPSAEQYN